MTTTTDTRPLPERLAQHTTHLRAKRMPTQDDRTSLQLLEELGLKHCQGVRAEIAGYPVVDEETALTGGSWIAAEDVLRQARLLAVALDGDAAARNPRLIDVVGPVIDELAALRVALAGGAQ